MTRARAPQKRATPARPARPSLVRRGAAAPREAEAAFYAYAVVAGEAAPSLAEAPPGLPGTRGTRAVEAAPGLWLVGADAPLPGYGSAAVEKGLQNLDWVSARALAHDGVISYLRGLGTVLPLRLFTLFSSEETARRHVQDSRAAIQRVLGRVADRDEWGVRVRLEELAPPKTAAVRPAASGTQFLVRKQQARAADREARARAEAEAQALHDSLSARADETRRHAVPETAAPARVLLDAAFLVPRGRAASFRRAVEQARKRLAAQGLQVELSGPWPPYNFVGAER